MGIFRIVVAGRVQGVNFRNMTKAYCIKKKIKGSVRNLKDGRVEIFAECGEGECEEFVDWLRTSPGFSRVREVNVEGTKRKEGFNDFEILREGNVFDDQARSLSSLMKDMLRF